MEFLGKTIVSMNEIEWGLRPMESKRGGAVAEERTGEVECSRKRAQKEESEAMNPWSLLLPDFKFPVSAFQLFRRRSQDCLPNSTLFGKC
jgi:hypothetical protein